MSSTNRAYGYADASIPFWTRGRHSSQHGPSRCVGNAGDGEPWDKSYPGKCMQHAFDRMREEFPDAVFVIVQKDGATHSSGDLGEFETMFAQLYLCERRDGNLHLVKLADKGGWFLDHPALADGEIIDPATLAAYVGRTFGKSSPGIYDEEIG